MEPLAEQSSNGPSVVIHNHPPKAPWISRWFFNAFLAVSLIVNFTLVGLYQRYYPNVTANEQFKEGDPYSDNKVALINVTGMLTSSAVQPAIKELRMASEDAEVKAIILSVDSPGGTIAGSDELYHAIQEFKRKTGKPVVASMKGMATSGAYYISAPADWILAERSCVTGSIGVIASLFTVEKLLADWGVNPEVIKSGPMKDSGSPFRSMTPEDRAEWQSLIDSMYRQFLDIILAHRAEKIGGEEKLRALADGRVYVATEAVKLGLIDAIGYQNDAIDYVKQRIGQDKIRVVTYARPFGSVLELLEMRTTSPLPFDWTRLAELQVPRLYLMPSPGSGLLPR